MVGQGTVLKNRWKLSKKIGQGAFGEIFNGTDTTNHDPVAVKLERWDNKKAVLKMEVAVLKKLQHCQHACRYVHCGHFEDHNYLVMELLGENLSELRRRRPGGRFSLWTTVRLGMQMLRAVEAIHELGYLHRDIKPSNFAMGLAPGRKDQCIMIDFGLTRKYRLPSGQIRPPRDIAGFRGTARYASINSHLSKELSRRDDLWSVLYVLIEFLTGQLPWRKLKDKEEIGLLKIHFNSAELVRDLPPPYLTFMQHLQSLDYLDRPDYAFLIRLLDQLGGGIAEHTPYDWEQEGTSSARPGGMPGGDGYNNSSYGSVRRVDTPGRERDVSTHEHQLSQLDADDWHQSNKLLDSVGGTQRGARGEVLDGSSAAGTPRQSARGESAIGADRRKERSSSRKAARESSRSRSEDKLAGAGSQQKARNQSEREEQAPLTPRDSSNNTNNTNTTTTRLASKQDSRDRDKEREKEKDSSQPAREPREVGRGAKAAVDEPQDEKEAPVPAAAPPAPPPAEVEPGQAPGSRPTQGNSATKAKDALVPPMAAEQPAQQPSPQSAKKKSEPEAPPNKSPGCRCVIS